MKLSVLRILDFKIAHINAQSFLPKYDELKLLLYSMQIDILCISETWLNADIGKTEIEIDNYVLYRLDWNDNPRRGI